MLTHLREKVGTLSPVPTSRHGQPTTYIPPNLQDCQYMFLRRDSLRSSLQKLYEGPFKVLQSDPTTFIIDMGGRHEIVSVDRLKPAHLDVDQPVQVAQPRRRGCPKLQPKPPSSPLPGTPYTTRSGRLRRSNTEVLGGAMWRPEPLHPRTIVCGARTLD
ncbi:hypothetical protein Pcinc_028493 [Petrolisthes cinctipes]|nr:hypothetical protein Pcinc_028485 [Petrolisthes cinctipes]KAK3865940.1 hypothetical protein Pcinc_028493 [Petrolisthes cinctipes]